MENNGGGGGGCHIRSQKDKGKNTSQETIVVFDITEKKQKDAEDKFPFFVFFSFEKNLKYLRETSVSVTFYAPDKKAAAAISMHRGAVNENLLRNGFSGKKEKKMKLVGRIFWERGVVPLQVVIRLDFCSSLPWVNPGQPGVL